MEKKVMIFGYGSCGQYLVDFILKDHRIKDIGKLYIVSRKSEDEVAPRLEISRVAAGLSKRFIPIKYISCDFNNIDRMSEIISLVEPNVIVYTGRYASGLKYGAFSYPHEIGYGVWLPMSFPYIYNLMKAVKRSGARNIKVINSSFPDGVNPLLKTIGLEPYCGAGNINHLIPRIKKAASEMFGDSPENYNVLLTCGHYVNTYLSKEGTNKGGDFALRVRRSLDTLIDFQGLSIESLDSQTREFLAYIKDNTASGQIRNQMIATDCAELVRYFVDPAASGVIHVPGVNGRPGGQAYNAFRGKLSTIEEHISDERAFNINTQNLEKDGVVIGEGYVEFTDEVRDKMKDVYCLEYPEKVYIPDLQKFADKIREKLLKETR